ncbi:hypothetical protein [Ekhidna sp.]|uniref:hypothetical protein n=1 Tax=Ekhidna sp. TaxID=2608089 RepID=UPI003B5CD9D4
MRQSQINRLEMMQDTNTYLDANTAIWSAIPILTTYKSELSQIIDDIRQSAQDQEAAQVFISKSTRELKLTIAEKMDILDDILEAYAADTGNSELEAKANNSKSDYWQLPNEDFETKVKNVIDLLEANVADMADYGFTQEQIDDAKLSFGTYQDRRGKPRSYQIASRIATTSIDDLMKEATVVLEKLDRVMKRFKRSNTTFYSGYVAARTIVDD